MRLSMRVQQAFGDRRGEAEVPVDLERWVGDEQVRVETTDPLAPVDRHVAEHQTEQLLDSVGLSQPCSQRELPCQVTSRWIHLRGGP